LLLLLLLLDNSFDRVSSFSVNTGYLYYQQTIITSTFSGLCQQQRHEFSFWGLYPRRSGGAFSGLQGRIPVAGLGYEVCRYCLQILTA